MPFWFFPVKCPVWEEVVHSPCRLAATRKQINSHTHKCTHITLINRHTHRHTHKHTHTHRHRRIHNYSSTQTHTHRHTDPQIHSHKHTHTHTHRAKWAVFQKYEMTCSNVLVTMVSHSVWIIRLYSL